MSQGVPRHLGVSQGLFGQKWFFLMFWLVPHAQSFLLLFVGLGFFQVQEWAVQVLNLAM